MRIQELLNLKRSDVDFDNLCFRVNGKGNKQRLVPMSIELRKMLFRHCKGIRLTACSVRFMGRRWTSATRSADSGHSVRGWQSET